MSYADQLKDFAAESERLGQQQAWAILHGSPVHTAQQLALYNALLEQEQRLRTQLEREEKRSSAFLTALREISRLSEQYSSIVNPNLQKIWKITRDAEMHAPVEAKEAIQEKKYI